MIGGFSGGILPKQMKEPNKWHQLIETYLNAKSNVRIFKNTKVMRKRNYKFLRSPLALLAICVFGVLFASNVGVHYAVYGQR